MSVENINPYNKYQGNGVTTEFSVDFPYNNKTDVVVYLKNEGEAQQTLVVNTDYTWLNDTTIKTTTAPADGSILAIYRETPAASDYNFENQRRLFPAEVTNSDNLAILLIQELRAMFSRTLTVDETSTVTPEELVDELNSLVITAAGYVSQCSGYSDLAQAWATKTDGPVSGGEYSSKYYAEQILPMADDINTVVTNISDINTAAANITDIQNASANALLAKDWAIKMDGVVEGSDYSAKYNAGLAAASASNASISETNAANSAVLAQQYANDKINQTHISNCITYIPQDIKLELNNGTLTLKAGSKVYNGNGLFAEVQTDTSLPSANYNGQVVVIYTSIDVLATAFMGDSVASLPSPSSSSKVYYNTTDKKCYLDTGSWLEVSFPIAFATSTITEFTSIDQIFNGFGYIGSTVFALPGLKGLCPDGRNEDETLKSFEFTISDVKTFSYNATGNHFIIIDKQENIAYRGSLAYYDEKENLLNNYGSMRAEYIIGKCYLTSGVISNLEIKTPFHALDYNDTEYIASQSFPGDKYINLTLGASGTTYTAPADGYIVMIWNCGSSTSYITMIQDPIADQIVYGSNYTSVSKTFKVRKGNFTINYANVTVSTFRFVYARGDI